MKVLTIVGARPQFIKAWPVGRAMREAGITEHLVHTGQHYDARMSQVFFDEMGIRRPDENLEVGSGGHGEQTGRMLIALERVMMDVRPDWVLVFGDTNTTLAGALAACKLQLPIAHVEAGLRSFNRAMPEEHNRVVVDHVSDLLLCPTQTAVEHLAREGVTRGVELVGDVMYDAVLHFGEMALARSRILESVEVIAGRYYLATIHRAYNTDDPLRLRALLEALDALGETVVFPIHPRTRHALAKQAGGIDSLGLQRVRLVDPVGYLDMLRLEQSARGVLTDSGGVQKEAYFFGVPCFTLRPETEWVETVASGWNVLVGTNGNAIVAGVRAWKSPEGTPPKVFGDGKSSRLVADLLRSSRP